MRLCTAAIAAPLLPPAFPMAENVQRSVPMVDCPLQNFRDTIEEISRQRKLMAAKITDRRRDVIPGYDESTIRNVVIE